MPLSALKLPPSHVIREYGNLAVMVVREGGGAPWGLPFFLLVPVQFTSASQLFGWVTIRLKIQVENYS